MGVGVTTKLMLGIKFERDEIPDDLLEYYCEKDYVINHNPEIRIVITNEWGDPCRVIIGYVIGSVDEMEDTIVEYTITPINYRLSFIEDTVNRFLTDHKLHHLMGKEVKLLMFNEFS